jgi:hypothetical protein
MLKLVKTEIKIVAIIIFHVFKKLSRDKKDIFLKTQIEFQELKFKMR